MTDTLQQSMFADELPPPDMIASLIDAYRQELLDNPPANMFREDNPKREGAAWHAAKRDVERFIAILDAGGHALQPLQENGAVDIASSKTFLRSVREQYAQSLRDNPPTPSFFEANANRENLIAGVTGKDVNRLIKLLAVQGLMIVEKEAT